MGGEAETAEVERRTGKETHGGRPGASSAWREFDQHGPDDLHAVWSQGGGPDGRGKCGQRVAPSGSSVERVPLAEAIGPLRTLPLEGGVIRAACSLGISREGRQGFGIWS